MTGRAEPPCTAARACRPLRADAKRNRARIVAAARLVFSEAGLDAPVSQVARRAGVGIATLLRRFPTRDELVAAAFEDKMAAYSRAIDEALADPDPWRGFRRYVETVCGMQAEDRGFTTVLTMTFPASPAFEADRDRSAAGFAELIRRAKAAGRLRKDFAHQDLVMILMANAGVVSASAGAAPSMWQRLVAYLLQAFDADAAAPLPKAPTRAETYHALLRAGRSERGAQPP